MLLMTEDRSIRKISVEQYWNLLKTVRSPIVIMGTPGLCKTSLPAQVAKEVGGTSFVIPVAQLSEPGDLLGCPEIVDREVIDDKGKRTIEKRQIYAIPDNLPTEGKGFIIVDDFNRANTLILQSLLHLAQFREFGDYKIPELKYDKKGNWLSGFKLVFTGNMDEGNHSYIVNEVDDAFYSRIICYKLSFDKIMWGKWARKEGIDEKFISFILKNSGEMVTPVDNPRAWSNGFKELIGCNDMDYIDLIMSGCVSSHYMLKTWLEKEWLSLNFDSRDVFDEKKHKDLIKIFEDKKGKIGEDGQTLFAERIATLNVKELTKGEREALCKFFHLMMGVDRERVMLAFIPVNKENYKITDNELLGMLV